MNISASLNRRAEDIRVAPMVVSELKFRDVQYVGWAKAHLRRAHHFFESNVLTASGGHAAERVRARLLCPLLRTVLSFVYIRTST
jgi:hypothetical protein